MTQSVLRAALPALMCGLLLFAQSCQAAGKGQNGVQKGGLSTPSSDASKRSQKRVLAFPNNRTVGTVFVYPSDYLQRYFVAQSVKSIERRQARGRIEVDKDLFVVFKPDQHFFANPNVDSLAADAIDEVDVDFVAMSDEEQQRSKEIMKSIGRLSGIKLLRIDKSDFTDSDLMELAKLPNLMGLTAYGVSVDGSCLKALSHLPKLKQLVFGRTKIEPSNLQYLSMMPQLIWLSLPTCGVKDRDVDVISKCKKMERLSLYHDDLTDACLKYMDRFEKLVVLDVSDSKITVDGLCKLKRIKGLYVYVTKPSAKEVSNLEKVGAVVKLNSREDKPVDPDVNAVFAPITRK